ncbi:MAG: CDP-diacylglycerol--glycerol-3-phosphate 3-phosphatidyltransferase [Planctomycetota bacterium]|jgi:CDP-diacylglycerol--glycerol-3-phosphate 3-phosphatidyltransferase
MATTAPEPSPVFNLPNQLTAARLVLAFVLFGLIEYHHWKWAFIVFAVAAFTDWLDGYLARKLNLGSTLGRNLDPLVDKVLICGAYIFLVSVDDSGFRAWMAVVVVARELIITSLRGYLESLGAVFGADMLGKIKMTLQCAALIAVLVALEWPGNPTLYLTRDIFIYAMLAATALSGIQYLYRAFAMLRR